MFRFFQKSQKAEDPGMPEKPEKEPFVFIEENADAMDYPDVREDSGYRMEDASLSPDVRKAMEIRRAAMKSSK